MSQAPIAYGIDFGTSNSLVSVAWPDRIEVVDVGAKRIKENLPSVIYLNADGNRAAGDPAIEQYLITAGHQSRLLVGIKSDLSDPHLHRTSSWERTWTLPDLVAIVLRTLKQAADRYTGFSVSRVVLGHPVAFVGTEGPQFESRQRLAVERLLQAAQQVGFDGIDTLEEPSAAALDEDIPEGTVVALDFGGGTFDVAVVEYGADEAEVVGLAGAAVGGERFDQLLFNAKVAPELGLLDTYISPSGGRERLPARVLAHSRSMLDLRSLLLDPALPAILQRFSTYGGAERLDHLNALLYGGFAFQFYQEVEEAKIRLSEVTTTAIDFHGRGLDVHIPVDRSEFESLIAEDVALLEATIRTALSGADVHPGSVVKVVRTGGSSSVPLFVEMVKALFPNAEMTQRPPYTTVVHGLALHAQGVWGG